MIAKYICFEEKCKAVLKERRLEEPGEGQVLVENDYSILSAGTECANYRGLQNTCTGSSGFPFNPGYSAAGRVLRCGTGVTKLAPGDRVIVNWGGHASHNIRNEDSLVKIQDDRVEQLDAAFVHIISFPMLAVRNLHIELGESVMVAGQGLLGLIAIQLAALSGGLPVFAADLSAARRSLALQLGADRVFNPASPDYVDSVLAATAYDPSEPECVNSVLTNRYGKGINCIIEVTGFAATLEQVLKFAAPFARISLLGCSRIPDTTIDFYRYIHRRGVTLIGANTCARAAHESRPGAWTSQDDYQVALKLLASGKLQVRPLLSNIVSPADADSVYQSIITSQDPPLGFAFDWSAIR